MLGKNNGNSFRRRYAGAYVQELPCFRVELKADQSALGAVCHQQVPAVRRKNHVAGMDAAASCLLDLRKTAMINLKNRYDLGKSGGHIQKAFVRR